MRSIFSYNWSPPFFFYPPLKNFEFQKKAKKNNPFFPDPHIWKSFSQRGTNFVFFVLALLCSHISSQGESNVTPLGTGIQHKTQRLMSGQHAGSHSNTTLHHAVAEGCADVVQALLDAGADIEKKDGMGRSPLLFACMGGCLDVVKMLVQAGAELRVRDEEGFTCLMHAAGEGHMETVRYLVGLGQVDVDQADGDHSTALHVAVEQNHADVVQVLIDAGADIEKKDGMGRSPLLFACQDVDLDIVKILVRAGAELHVTDYDGFTCLITAAEKGRTETVRYLVGLGQVDVDQRDVDLNAALYEASVQNHADVVRVLIDVGTDLEKPYAGGSSLLFACMGGCLDVVKMLVQAGAELRVTDNHYGRTCLITAAKKGRTETVRYLVGLGQVDVDQADGNHNTALHVAVEKNHADVVRVLIDAGADIEKPYEGGSPLLFACMGGCLDVVKMLVQSGAKLHVTDHYGRTCLITAAEGGHTEIVRYLVGLEQVDVDQADGNHNTALHVAVEKNHADVVQVLIDAGADKMPSVGSGRAAH